MKKKRNIVLIGFMGSGKTSIGMKLARAFSYEFLDSDCRIEEEQQQTINDIFAKQGEIAFRNMETELLMRLAEKQEKFVLGTGGGMPMREENVDILKQIGLVVFLKAGQEELIRRLTNDTTRPLLAEGDIQDKVENLYAKRLPIYEAAADYILETDGKSFYEIIKEIEEFCFPERKWRRGGRKNETVTCERTES